MLLIALGFLVYFMETRRRESLAQYRRDIDTLKQTVGALCSSAVGVDKRVNRLEQMGRDLEERQENIEQHSQYGDPPYSDAIRIRITSYSIHYTKLYDSLLQSPLPRPTCPA